MHIFIYPFILYRLFYFFHFILFYFIYYLLSTIRIFLLLFFFIYFVIICPVPGCSGMFRNVPECSGMFRNVPCSRYWKVSTWFRFVDPSGTMVLLLFKGRFYVKFNKPTFSRVLQQRYQFGCVFYMLICTWDRTQIIVRTMNSLTYAGTVQARTSTSSNLFVM